ncbi:MAG: tyrosine phenol-lyase [Elusimicrobia bacterium]|nr:MAG: tyrosine phenol-lyase [Elusimicrobiota bacterium]
MSDNRWKTAFEPYRAKTIEPLGESTEIEREELLRQCDYNLFRIPAEKVIIDLLTDSGTSALSAEQRAGLERGDESYAGSRSWLHLESTVRDITDMREIIPVHQGRAAEHLLFSELGDEGKRIVSNGLFDSTRANILAAGAEPWEIPILEGLIFERNDPFKGNIDTLSLEAELKQNGDNVPLVVMTITNNSLGGHPVSIRNLRDASEICRHYKTPFFLDACRYAENAFLIQQREPGAGGRPVEDIAREAFQLADGCWISAKKDGLSSTGGVLALRDQDLAQRLREHLIVVEGYPTHGGLAGRDLECIALGLRESLDESYLKHRIGQIEAFAKGLRDIGVPIIEPPGGHAVFIDASAMFPDLSIDLHPAATLACEIFRTGGIRGVAISAPVPRRRPGQADVSRMELVRFAIPRRAYTQNHLDFIIEVLEDILRRASAVPGLRRLDSNEHVNHFGARLEPAG